MSINLIVIICFFLAGVYSFISGVKHLLSLLISLEFIILIVYVAIGTQLTRNSLFIASIFLILCS